MVTLPTSLDAPDQQTYGPKITFQTKNILPPGAVYVGRDDIVVLNVRCPGVSVTLDVDVRWLNPQGEIIPTQFNTTVQTTGATATEFRVMGSEGFLLSASVFGTAITRGQCFIKLYVKRGTGLNDSNNGPLLMQGYVSADDWLSYPQSPTESSLNGRGWLQRIAVPSPAPGSQWAQVVPAGRRWLVRSVFSNMGTSATVANRVYAIQVRDTTPAQAVVIPPQGLQTAGISASYTWAPGNDGTNLANTQSMGFPQELILPQGWEVSAFCSAFQAGDTFTGIVLIVEEYIAQ